MKPKVATESPAVEFLNCVWKHDGSTDKSKSWRRLNAALQTTLAVAIRSGFKFSDQDFFTIQKRFNSGFWIGDGETYYAMACASAQYPENQYGENLSACIAFETWINRPAFILEDRDGRRRLAVGSNMTWNGERTRITSIKGESLVTCSYKNQDRTKINKRYTVSSDEISAYSKAWRKAQKTPETV